MVAAKSMSGRKMKRLSKLLKPISEPVPLEPPVEGLTSCGGENCCVEMVPIFFAPGRLKILMPSWVSSVRFTSANLTSSRISPVGVAGTSIKLVTFGAAALTTSRILSATTAEDTRPERITMSREVSTCTGSDGNTSWIFWLNPRMSMSTETSNAWLWSASSHSSSETPPGAFPLSNT